MQITRLSQLQQPQFWLLSLLAGLYAIYLTLVWRNENVSHLAISLLFGLAVLSLLHDKHQHLSLNTGKIDSGVGAVLILGVLWYSATPGGGSLLRLLPIASGLGVGLLASGFRGLKQFTQELILFFFLGVPSVVASLWIDIAPMTAQWARLLLLYIGFEVAGQGIEVQLPTGSVNVIYDCSGIDQMNYLLGLSVLGLVMFPLRGWFKKILVPIVGLMLGFLTNVVRVAIMTIFAASNEKVFDLWHTGQGSYIFAFLAVLLFGLFYRWLLKQEELTLQVDSKLQ
jgi:cyanoexosortase A